MDRKIICKKLLLGCIFLLLLWIGGYFLTGCCLPRFGTLEYNIIIEPQKRETLNDVTIYFPFPSYKGNPVKGVLSDMNRWYNEYAKNKCPGVTLDLIKTNHGKMLRIQIPRLDRAFSLFSRTSFNYLAFDRTLPPDKYLLLPMEDEIEAPIDEGGYGGYPESPNKFFTYVYSEYEGGSGLILRNKYTINYAALWPSQVAGSGGGLTYIGLEELPKDHAPLLPLIINWQGWKRILGINFKWRYGDK